MMRRFHVSTCYTFKRGNRRHQTPTPVTCCPLASQFSYTPLPAPLGYPQNRKYITYCNVAIGCPSYGHRQRAQKIYTWLLRYSRGQTDTDRQTDRQTETLLTILRSPTGSGATTVYINSKILVLSTKAKRNLFFIQIFSNINN